MIKAIFALLVILFPIASIAQEAASRSGHVRVILEYKSMFPGKIQVIDKVCNRIKNIECTKANIKIYSESCQKEPAPSECKEAKDLLDTSFCMDGLVYEGSMNNGEKIKVDLCTSAGGYGNMSVRDIDKGNTWTNYSLLSDGQTLSYP